MQYSLYDKVNKDIKSLPKNGVFVFGSNRSGFHGAGSAGLAMRGDSRNNWREDIQFKLAMNSPIGSPNRKGKWAVYGISRGYQEGTDGKSYAIQTIDKPGKRRSIPLEEIKQQIVTLLKFAKEHPQLEFFMTPVGCGYAGYTPSEMLTIWNEAIELIGFPTNMKIPEGLYESTNGI